MRRIRMLQAIPRGTSTLEFIVVLPSFLLVMFGAIELSRAWMTMNVVTQAAREGARVGSVSSPFDAGAALARIDQVLSGANLTAASKSVSCAAPCDPDSAVTATVTVNFQTLFPLLLPMMAGPWPLTNTATMRYE